MGHTYGEHSVMQMYVPGRDKPAYGAELHWEAALDAPAASQMRHLMRLILSRPHFDRVPDQSLILAHGLRFARLLATLVAVYSLLFTFHSRSEDLLVVHY